MKDWFLLISILREEAIRGIFGEISGYVLLTISILAFTGAGLVVRYVVKRSISSRLTAEFARAVAGDLSSAIVFWSLLGGIDFGLVFLNITEETSTMIDQTLFIAVSLSITLVIAYILGDLIRIWGTRIGPQVSPITGVGQFAIKIIILTIGLLVILGTMGIQISPALASLGIAGLAVALALQPTLSNFFAGLYIMADKPVRIGDYIRLETGEEGFVTDIGWRSTRVRLLPNNTVVIPNQRLSDSVILNYYYPEEKLALLMEIKVSYEDDPKEVEKILVEEMVKASFEIDGMVTAYEMTPFVRFIPGYEESSLNFTTICQVREAVDRYYVQHELRKRIWDRFKEEGITVPFPVRTIHFQGHLKDLKDLKQFIEEEDKDE